MKKKLCSISVIFLIIGVLARSAQAEPTEIQWSQIADLLSDQHAACAAVIDDLVYMVGGQNPPGPPNYNKMRIYDPCTDSWSDGPSMSTRRYWPASGVIEGPSGPELYVVGGYSGFAGLSTVERYTPSAGTWQTVASVSNPRGHGIMTAVVNNNLYAIGGFYNSGICYNTNEMYDRDNNTWISKSPMPVAMQAGVSAAWNDKIYIFGGWQSSGNLTTTMIYDTVANTWSYGADIPRERTFGGAVTFGNYIYLIGGAGCSDIIDVYDPENDLWLSTCNYPGNNNCSPAITQSDVLVYVLGDNYEKPGALECWVGKICEPVLTISVDIKPTSCPNPLNIKSTGVLPVAILGTEDFDVNTIDVASIMLEGVDPVRSNYEDVATPVSDGNECGCTTEGPDGFMDLTLKFETQEIVEAIGDVNNFDRLSLTLEGVLYDETPIQGEDCIIILKARPRPRRRGR